MRVNVKTCLHVHVRPSTSQVAATHQFDKSITETVVRDNVNPIDRVERSTLILASTVHRVPCADLTSTADVERIAASAPDLFPDYALRSKSTAPPDTAPAL